MKWNRTMQTQEKILAVDDDPNNVAILEELLENHYDLKVVTNGEQAMKIARDFRPDIVLVDIMMPGMNGYEVCRRLREDGTLKHTKIIMVSARAMVSERLQGYQAGADDYITKPFDGDEFLAKVRVYLRLKHAEELEHIRDEITIAAMETLSAPVVVARKIISEISDNAFGQIDPELRHQLDTADWCMDDLERIIHSFLDISQIYAGTVQLQASQFSMQSVVQEVVDAQPIAC
jgi:DNA-binding response OmpR family regulator